MNEGQTEWAWSLALISCDITNGRFFLEAYVLNEAGKSSCKWTFLITLAGKATQTAGKTPAKMGTFKSEFGSFTCVSFSVFFHHFCHLGSFHTHLSTVAPLQDLSFLSPPLVI